MDSFAGFGSERHEVAERLVKGGNTMIRSSTTRFGVCLGISAVLAWVVLTESTAAQVPRIAKQPAYKGARQQYLLLLLGQDPPQKIWIVRDGSDVYVDRNGNGDLTEEGEKVVQADTNESASYVRLGMVRDARGQEHGPLACRLPTRGATPLGQVRIHIAKKFEQEASFVLLADSPENAAIVHCDGPLRAGFLGHKDSRPVPTENPRAIVLSRKRPHLVQAWLGTQVKNFPAASCVTFSVTGEDNAKRPQLKIVYENLQPGVPPIVETHVLEEETRTIFSRLLKAPAHSGSKAKLRLTVPFPAKIPPYEIEVDVRD